MRLVTKLSTFLITIFILIGDGTLTFFQFLLKPFNFNIPKKQPQKTPKKRRIQRQYFPVKSKLKYFTIGVIFSLLFVGMPLGIFVTIHSLPDPTMLSLQDVPQTTKIYDRHHTLLYQIYANQNRTIVKLNDIPLFLREGTIAIEDKNFYKNPGFDIIAIVRAALADIKGRSLQGGSTITQQLVKTALLTSDRSLQRKIEEVFLSFWAERLYSKDQILEMYLNQVAYGGTAWGVETASQTYFGKSVKNLDLAESAFLAGLPQAPTTYSPYGDNPTLWKKRQRDVLNRMQELGFISKDQKEKALSEELVFETPQIPLLAPHFVMYVRDLLIQKYGLDLVEKGGLSVVTTLDLPTQDMAQKVVSTEVAKDGYLNLTNGAAVVTNPKNGDILAMVGSHDYNDPQDGAVNVATSHRQPGSSIKIVTYAAALTSGYTATSVLDDSPVNYTSAWGSVYAPVNYDGRWHGKVSLRIALANSLNIPAVKTLNDIGIPAFVSLGRQMGIRSLLDPDNYGLSVTLGSADVTMLDMATAYGTVANSGRREDLNPLLLVTDNKGNVLEQKGNPDATQVLDPGVAFILSNILADNNARSMEFGPSSPLYIPGKTVSVKTGTTDNKRDNWTMGFNSPKSPSQYVVTVWVGNNDNTPMSQDLASGITGAAPIWHAIMANLLQGKKDTPLTPPKDIVSKQCGGRTEYFVSGTEDVGYCAVANTPSVIPSQQLSPIIQIVTQDSSNQTKTQ